MKKNEQVICNGNHPIRIADRKTSEKNEGNIRDLWGNVKYANLCIMESPEGEDREKGQKFI